MIKSGIDIAQIKVIDLVEEMKQDLLISMIVRIITVELNAAVIMKTKACLRKRIEK